MPLTIGDYTRMQKRILAGTVRIGESTSFMKQWVAEHGVQPTGGYKPVTSSSGSGLNAAKVTTTTAKAKKPVVLSTIKKGLLHRKNRGISSRRK